MRWWVSHHITHYVQYSISLLWMEDYWTTRRHDMTLLLWWSWLPLLSTSVQYSNDMMLVVLYCSATDCLWQWWNVDGWMDGCVGWNVIVIVIVLMDRVVHVRYSIRCGCGCCCCGTSLHSLSPELANVEWTWRNIGVVFLSFLFPNKRTTVLFSFSTTDTGISISWREVLMKRCLF